MIFWDFFEIKGHRRISDAIIGSRVTKVKIQTHFECYG